MARCNSTIQFHNGYIMNRKIKFANRTAYILITLVSTLLFTQQYGISQTPEHNWNTISGKWDARTDNKSSYAIEAGSKTRNWGYSELINYNSLIMLQPLTGYSSIQYSIELLNPTATSETMLFFAAGDYRQFYAFKLTGNADKINRLLFISSSIKDTTLPPSAKWNFAITELESKDVEMEYNKEYSVEIRVKKNTAKLYIDGKKVMAADAPDELTGGKIGFSNRNAIVKIASVKVYGGKTVLFEDDFSKDTIKRYRVTATKISKEEYQKQQKKGK